VVAGLWEGGGIELKMGGRKEGRVGEEREGGRRSKSHPVDASYVQDEHDTGPMEGVLSS
jgi:hypothetical protein